MTEAQYKEIWGTKIGKQCLNLDKAIARWLGKRLVHLGTHTCSRPLSTVADEWNGDLIRHGYALLAYAYDEHDTMEAEQEACNRAKDAMGFVAEHFGQLWD